MNHVVLSGLIKYDPDIIYVFETRSTVVRFSLMVKNLAGNGQERHKIKLSGKLAVYVRDHLNKNDRIELTGRLKPGGIHTIEFQNELIEWITIRKLD